MILRRLRAMNGFVGLRLSRNRRQGETILRECGRSLKRGYAGRVVGQVALIALKAGIMKIDEVWHSANVLGRGATWDKRIDWHLRHRENCGCRELPKSVTEALVGKKVKTCTRGHRFIAESFCLVCWPGGVKKAENRSDILGI